MKEGTAIESHASLGKFVEVGVKQYPWYFSKLKQFRFTQLFWKEEGRGAES